MFRARHWLWLHGCSCCAILQKQGSHQFNKVFWNIFQSKYKKWKVAHWLAAWLPGWLAAWLASWLAGWLASWLAGWLVGWLVGWFKISKRILKPGPQTNYRNSTRNSAMGNLATLVDHTATEAPTGAPKGSPTHHAQRIWRPSQINCKALNKTQFSADAKKTLTTHQPYEQSIMHCRT